MSASPPAQPRKSSVLPIVLSIAGGILLAYCSCYGFFAWGEENMNLNTWFFTAGFVVGIALLIVGLGDAGKYVHAKFKENS